MFNDDFQYKNPKKPLVLFFINGMVPTPDDKAYAATLVGKVVFRNARFISPEHALEPCDAVAGDIPENYSKLPLAAVRGMVADPVLKPTQESRSAAGASAAPKRGRPTKEQTTSQSDPTGWGRQ